MFFINSFTRFSCIKNKKNIFKSPHTLFSKQFLSAQSLGFIFNSLQSLIEVNPEHPWPFRYPNLFSKQNYLIIEYIHDFNYHSAKAIIVTASFKHLILLCHEQGLKNNVS